MLSGILYSVVVLSAFLRAAQGQTMNDKDRIGLIVGCTIGGLILVVFILVLLLLLCCRSLKKPTNKKYEHDNESQRSGELTRPRAREVPPGIWTSKPTMVTGMSPQFKPVPDHLPIEPEEMKSRGYQDVPWYKRTVRQARNALKRFPAVFHAQKTTSKDAAAWTSETRYNDGKLEEVVQEINLQNETVKTSSNPPRNLPCAPDVEENIRNSKTATARVFSHFDKDGTAIDLDQHVPTSMNSSQISAGSPYVAKMYSDYQNPRDCLPPNENEASMARAYSNSQLSIDRVDKGPESRSTFVAKAIVREDSRDSAYVLPQDAVRMVQSEMNLHVVSYPVARCSSHVDKGNQRPTKSKKKRSVDAEIDQRYDTSGAVFPVQSQYGRGVFMRSPSDVKDYSHLRKDTTQILQREQVIRPKSSESRSSQHSGSLDTNPPSYKKNVQRDASDMLSSSKHPAAEPPTNDMVARVYSRPPSQSSEKKNSLQRYQAPDNPEAIYTVPAPASTRLSGTVSSSSVTPPVAEQRDMMDENSHEMRSSDKTRKTSKSVRSIASVGHADKKLVGEAFEFLDDFDDVSLDGVDGVN